MSTEAIITTLIGVCGGLLVALMCLFIMWINDKDGRRDNHEVRIKDLEDITGQHSELLAAQSVYNEQAKETLEIVRRIGGI